MKAWRFILFFSVLMVIGAFRPEYFDSIPDKETSAKYMATLLAILAGIDIYELLKK